MRQVRLIGSSPKLDPIESQALFNKAPKLVDILWELCVNLQEGLQLVPTEVCDRLLENNFYVCHSILIRKFTLEKQVISSSEDLLLTFRYFFRSGM